MNTKICEIITDRIVSLLNSGVCPWRRPWNRINALPQNLATGHQYSGINFLLLLSVGFELPYFLTYKQVSLRGGTVKTGSKGFPVIYWSLIEGKEADEEKEGTKIPFLRYYTVFNASQIDGVPFPPVPSRTGETFVPLEMTEAVVTGWKEAPKIAIGFKDAAYIPASDTIVMPSPSSFDTPAEYYASLFHEMGHATGAATRLDRKLSVKFGDDAYSREELVAEMTAAFLCAHCGLDQGTLPNHAAYVVGWIMALKADSKLVVWAAGQAQKAARMILGGTGDEAAQADNVPQAEPPVAAVI